MKSVVTTVVTAVTQQVASLPRTTSKPFRATSNAPLLVWKLLKSWLPALVP